MRVKTQRSVFFLLGLLIFGVGIVSSTTITKTYHLTVRAPGGSCPSTVGTITLRATSPRLTGVSPLLVFFDATTTTDTALTGNTDAFQDLQYSWNFGDGGASGTGTWIYGSRPGANGKNAATGAIAAHAYVTTGADVSYSATVTVKNSAGVTASCALTVTAYDPSGSSGFPGSNTTCASASGLPVAGVAGCPAGALVINSSSVPTLLGSGHLSSGKRILFKCGDTFSGESPTINGVIKASVGAYGGCENTQVNRPIFSDTGTGNQITIGYTSGDVRVADIHFEGHNTANAAVAVPGGADGVPYQLTWINLYSNGNKGSYSTSQGHEVGIIDSVQNPDPSSPQGIGVFLNFGGNNPSTWTGPFPTDDYLAFMGNYIDAVQTISAGSGIETVRIAACRLCVIENNRIANASTVGAVLKLHNANPGSSGTWTGVYTEYMEISDNWFTGHSGGQMVEIEPQNSSYDERLRHIVFERNRIDSHSNMGVMLQVSASNTSIRDNVLYTAAGLSNPGYYGIQIASRGIEPTPTAMEVYNNTGYVLVPNGMQFIAAAVITTGHPANNSYIKNNMFYTTTTSGTGTVQNTGTGNTVSNNTVTVTNNPGMTNGSGSFSAMSDFKPTANYSGGTAVPVYTDALGATWSPTWGLGAVRASGGVGACPVTSGGLTLRAGSPRTTGVAPFLAFFDATATTSSTVTGATTAFQDVTFVWNFGDSGASGTSTWAYGSRPGVNSRNTATGGVAAHLYVTAGSDIAYTATVTATDGTNTATCTVPATASDPQGAGGFPGTETTCQAAASTPVAGSGGCPAGASVLNSASEGAAVTSSMSGKRVLFKCGDSFSGGATFGGTKFSVGAYGGCEGTQTSRPIMHGAFSVSTGTVTDGRVSDLDFESTGSWAISTTGGNPNGPMTLYNLRSSGNGTSYYWAQGHEWALVNSQQTSESSIGTFINYAQNNCANGSALYLCGGGGVFNNINYQALLGNSVDGSGAGGGPSGIETVRFGACRLCVIENNTIENANNVGAVLKLTDANVYTTNDTWIGQYAELIEISDNAFGGASGSQLTEVCAQNGQVDERLRNIVVERNLFTPTTANGRGLLLCAVNASVRDNVFDGTASNPLFGIQIVKRGTSSQGVNTPVPTGVEIYNNTGYGGGGGGGALVGFNNVNFGTAGANSYAKNNLFYNAGGGTTILNSGSGNTVSNNTATPTSNPGFTNSSGVFNVLSDFKPTANYSGGTVVPVYTDALGVTWSPTWSLGAVHP